AQCGTDRDLLAPLDRSREEEPRGIDRCDQEQRQGRTLEEEEGEHVFPGGSAGERVDREPAHPLLRGRSPSSPAWIAVSMARASSAGTPGRSRPITLRWRGAVCSVALPTVLPVGLLGVPSLALPVAPPATLPVALPVAPPAAPPSCSLSGSLPHPLPHPLPHSLWRSSLPRHPLSHPRAVGSRGRPRRDRSARRGSRR